MSDIRISPTATPASRAASKPAPQSAPDSTPKPAMGGDQLQTQAGAASREGIAIVREALQFPPKPKRGEDMTPWLMDVYSRMLKAESTLRTLQKSKGDDRVDGRTYADLRQELWGAQREIEKLDKDGAVKTEFFQTILPPAQELIDGLESYPAPPADPEGKAAWLADAKQALAKGKAADELMTMAWFNFKALDFDARTDSSGKLFDFEMRVRHVEYELNPPAPRSSTSGASKGSTSPIFGNTQSAAKLADSKNPVSQAAGAVALPFAVTIDVIDLITRPFRWLEEQKK